MNKKKKKKGGGFAGLYIMIGVCVVFSAVAVFGLMGKLEGYKESDDSYHNLQQAAVSIITDDEPTDASENGASPMRTISPQELLAAKENDGDGEAVEGVYFDPTGTVEAMEDMGPESEEVVDEALIWMLNNQTEDELITDLPKAQATPAPAEQAQAAGNAATPAPAVDHGQATTVTEAPQQAQADMQQPQVAQATAAPAMQAVPETAAAALPSDAAAPATISEGEENTPVNDAAISFNGDAAMPATVDEGEANTPENDATEAPTTTPEPTPVPTPTVPPYIPSSGISMERAVTLTSARYAVDFDYLTLINDEVVGWLYQEDTPINYPVVRGEDNEYYLTHLFDGTINGAGSVFMDSGNSAAFIDSATYLYAHHSKGGGMFASLSEYLDPAYYEAHPQLLLVTPFADYQVDVFAGMATLVEDEYSWRPKTLETEQDLNEFLDAILSQSFIQAPEDKLPVWGDRLLVLVTCTNIQSNQRYVIYGRMRPIVYATDEASVNATKMDMDQRPTGNGYVEIEGLGTFMHYAQNDVLWEKMRYESSGGSYRTFGNGGCSPTAVAMAIANLCTVEELPRLIGYSNTQIGYTFCDCSVNRYFCDHRHAQYQLRAPDEFLRYMPLAVANFATGNNIWDIKSRGKGNGTNMRYLDKICAIYGIRVSVIEEPEELFRRMEEEKVDGIKRMAIGCAVGGSPFTRSGHFVLICGLDEEYTYFLDPWRRVDYSEYDRRGYAEVLAPGVVRIHRDNIKNCNLIPFYLLEKVQ